MLNNKQKFNLDSYLSMLALFDQYAYDSCEKDASLPDMPDQHLFLTILDYTRLYLIADLAVAYFDGLEKDMFEKKLFAKFYQTYPSVFVSDLKSAIKSPDTQLGDICTLLCDNFTDEPFTRLELLTFISKDLIASLKLFATLFKSTKLKNGWFILDFNALPHNNFFKENSPT